MKYIYLFLITSVLGFTACQTKNKQVEETNHSKLDCKIGIQTYTFHKFTLMETLDKTKELGLDYAEAFFFQELGDSFGKETYLNYDLSQTQKEQLKKEFEKRGIKPYSFGVAFYDTIEDWEKFFTFSKEMGIHTVTCEPKLEHLDFVEQMALKYQIEVAIHNHPDPSVYADPNVLVKALEGRHPIMGVCADIGHWKRSGFDPIETLRKFDGRIKVVHLKDLSSDLEDTTWGTGILPVKEAVEELKKQQFDGLISIEYENFSDSQIDDIEKSLKFFESVRN
ncbi:L-ribulose-5-phosphate 3-epimerase [Parabacteroides sp. PF5-9]|nr:L-ribulose-5-phosphate 3-epimerase [Parabacteroides sp. PF5-9]